MLRSGVLESVRQRLLHDPVGGQLDCRRQRSRRALDLERDLEAGRANLVDEAVELVEAGLGLVFGRVLEDPEHAAEVGERGARSRC